MNYPCPFFNWFYDLKGVLKISRSSRGAGNASFRISLDMSEESKYTCQIVHSSMISKSENPTSFSTLNYVTKDYQEFWMKILGTQLFTKRVNGSLVDDSPLIHWYWWFICQIFDSCFLSTDLFETVLAFFNQYTTSVYFSCGPWTLKSVKK